MGTSTATRLLLWVIALPALLLGLMAGAAASVERGWPSDLPALAPAVPLVAAPMGLTAVAVDAVVTGSAAPQTPALPATPSDDAPVPSAAEVAADAEALAPTLQPSCGAQLLVAMRPPAALGRDPAPYLDGLQRPPCGRILRD